MKKELDDMLKQALTPMDEPDFWLNQKILSHAKETSQMDKKKVLKSAKRIPALVLSTAIVIAAGSATAYAAWRYLTPDAVAELNEDEQLQQAFRGEDAILVNETQSYGGYDITLLGIISGEGLSDFGYVSGADTVDADRTYSVVAIANSDGSEMASTSDDAYGETPFFVSPLIEGLDPNQYNAVTMQGGYFDIVRDGVRYRIAECSNVEIFADRTIYLCVSDGSFYNQNAYTYDMVTGAVTRNESYGGVNALFTLPIDASKADSAAAEEYMMSMQEPDETEGADMETSSVDQFMSRITPENIGDYLVRLEQTVMTVTPKDGAFTYEYDLGDFGSGSGTGYMDTLFPDGKTGMSDMMDYSYSGDGTEKLMVYTFVLNDDGTVMFAVYVTKESEVLR